MDYQFELINRENFTKYQKFTFPRNRNAFESLVNDGYLGIGAFAEGTPLGLILGKSNKEYPGEMFILSVFVITDYRRKGLATMLFSRFEAEAKRLGYKGVQIRYINNRESIPYIEKILTRLGWNPPEVSDYIYKCRSADFDLEWISKFQLRESFSDCNWTELTETEKKYLRAGCRVWYPAGLDPFLEEEKIIPELTLFLKHQGRIIGWFSAFEASAEMITYRSVFVKQEFQRTGAIVPLIFKAGRIHFETMKQYPYAAFQVAVKNKVMEKIIKKVMAKEFVSITTMLISYKII